MNDTPTKPAKEAASARQDRLRHALRDNLKRRKSQSRGRAGLAGDVASTADPMSTAQDICSRSADLDQD